MSGGFHLPARLRRTHGQLRPLPGAAAGGDPDDQAYGCGVVVRTAADPRRRVFPARPVASLVWVVAGRGHYRDADGQHPLTAGCCFLRRPGRAHRVDPDPERHWIEWWLRLPPSFFAHLAACGLWRDQPTLWQPGLDTDLRARFVEVHRRVQADDEAIAVLAAGQAFVHLAYRLDRDRRRRAGGLPAALEDAAASLAAVAAPELPLPELCRRYGVGYERFRKAFRARFGCAPLAWRNRHRLQRACSLLATGDDDLASVARAAGYPSVAHLAKQLRRSTGLGPQAYRARFGG